jgi:hypothetical protein
MTEAYRKAIAEIQQGARELLELEHPENVVGDLPTIDTCLQIAADVWLTQHNQGDSLAALVKLEEVLAKVKSQ